MAEPRIRRGSVQQNRSGYTLRSQSRVHCRLSGEVLVGPKRVLRGCADVLIPAVHLMRCPPSHD